MEVPEWNFGFEYDNRGRVNILRSPFFDVGFDFDDTVEDYLDRILPALVESIDDHFSVYTWIVEGRRFAPPPRPASTSPSLRIYGTIALGVVSSLVWFFFSQQA
ncbi:hypothetical protein MA16_Dca012402 [Dendrobium catenatum]|uniref:Uncharacterized protein n=1 Tax=Dendrobium catenatum TaxID=906689 RepID=A0A2I0WYA8_9ASPA|nr:hypothetical protein MA16_Dca012402 [Dendrobium catenatum]